MTKYEIKEIHQNQKYLKSPNYNYVFNRDDGRFMRWGEHFDDDPDFSEFGPEIADIEISTICRKGCSFCYKSNTASGKNMTIETFQKIFAKLPDTVCQIAFGIGDLDANPDIWKILGYSRDNDVIPNITVNGYRLTEQDIEDLSLFLGAVAISNYDKDICYRTVQRFATYIDEPGITLKQVNIHQLLCEETYDQCMELLHDVKNDPRLEKLNAVVFLIMKPKGKRNKFHQLRDMTKYRNLINYAFELGVPIGFDSCTAPSFLRAVKDRPEYEQLKMCAEPCESTCFSIYIDVDGNAWPCSFCEGMEGISPISIENSENFLRDVWHSDQFRTFRQKLLDSSCKTGCRECPVFDVEIR